MNKEQRGAVCIAASMVLFALIGPFVRIMSISNFVILFYGGFLALFALLGYGWYRGKLRNLVQAKDKKTLIWVGVLNALLVFTYYQAYEMTTFANTIFPHYLAPVVAALGAPFLLGEKLERKTVLALGLSMSGLFFILQQQGFALAGHGLGILLATLSGLFYGLIILYEKKLLCTTEPWIIMVYQMSFFFVWIPFIQPAEYLVGWSTFLWLVLYTGVILLLAIFLALTGFTSVKAQHAGIIAYVEPFAVLLLGWILFGETLTNLTAVGGILILYSGYMIVKG